MGLLNPYMEKMSLSSDTLELEAGTDESLLVTDIQIDNLANVEFAKITIDRMTVGYFDCYDAYSNGLYKCIDISHQRGILRQLRAMGLFAGYPLASGQKLIVDITGATNNNCRVLYERYDPGDIMATAPNGTEASEYLFINYGQNKSTITLSTYGELDESLNPAEFPDFPFGDTVPANVEIDILGVFPSTRRAGVSVGDDYTYLRFMKERTVMFDEDKNGFYLPHGFGNFPQPSEWYDREMNLFPVHYTFYPGEEVTVELKAAAGADILTDQIYVALLERVRKI